MKLRTALYDGHTELATIDDLVGITLGTPVFPTGNAGEVVFVDGSNHAATSENFIFTETPDGDNSTSLLTLSATGIATDPSTASIGVELQGGVNRVMMFRGDNVSYAMFDLAGTIIASPGMKDMTIEANEGGAIILRSDTIGAITHSNEIFISGIDDEIDITFISAGAGGLYIRPTFFKPADDNLQSFGARSGGRWKDGFFGTAIVNDGYDEFGHIATPSAPASGMRVYCKTVGGKEAMYVLFPSGAEQQIKIEA